MDFRPVLLALALTLASATTAPAFETRDLGPIPGRVGVYFGTFDPVHEGHLGAVNAARRALRLETVFVVPNPVPRGKPGALPLETRTEMVRRALGSSSGFVLPDPERMQAAFDSGTVPAMIRAVRAAANEPRVFFQIMGTDSFEKLCEMTDPGVVLRGHAVLVVARPGHALGPRARAVFRDHFGRVALVRDVTLEELSSTEIRRALASGRRRPRGLPGPVETYIVERGLYGTAGTP